MDILSAGPGVSVQDLGRPGYLACGLAEGGAADRHALWEGAALLGLAQPVPALELAGFGGRFRFSAAGRFALTGAPMRASLDGRPLLWNASHAVLPGDTLEIGAAEAGVYGYLMPAGGIRLSPAPSNAAQNGPDDPSEESAAGGGVAGAPPRLQAGVRLMLGVDPRPDGAACRLPVESRFQGGRLRVMPGSQSALFDALTHARAYATAFRAGPGNRQGLALHHEGAAFGNTAGSGLVSDFVTPGDVQMTGTGQPVILLAECQTVGGYPRLGTVIPADLPIAAQAAPGTALWLEALDLAEADALCQPEEALLAQLRRQIQPVLRAPHDIPDLLGYQLISGAVRGDEEDG